MNPFTDFLFTVSWFILLVWGIRTMARGWNLMSTPLKPENDDEFSYKVQKKTVTKIPHPEMADVKNGDELLVVKFGEEEIKDPLLQSLENRITELNDFDDEEDDDGDVVVRK
jgi:hypothetical protein